MMVDKDVVFTAYFETDFHSVCVCYEPGPDGAIFITSVTIEPLPITPFQERRPKHRQKWSEEDPSIEKENAF